MDSGVRCPNGQCQEAFLYDWCQDNYKTIDNKNAIEEMIFHSNPDTEDEVIITKHTCPSCNCILGFVVFDPEGSSYFNHENWSGIDWGEHAVEEPMVSYD